MGDTVEEEDLAEEPSQLISSIILHFCLVIKEGRDETHCEQKANLIGTQLFISRRTPPTTGQSIAFRSPLRTWSRSCSEREAGMRRAL